MDHFDYREGRLHAEDVPLDAIADIVGTPFYCYCAATIRRHYRVFAEAFTKRPGHEKNLVAYAMKANSNLAVVATLAGEGAGCDIVSGGELRRALAAGVPASKILFSGVGKTREEMADALRAGIAQFNVESEPELEALSEVARSLDMTARVSLRVNPDVDAGTHHKISTGKAENKFGIPMSRAREVYTHAAGLHGLSVIGVDLHIGSQLINLEPFREAYSRAADLVDVLRGDGHTIDHLDLGGGLGIPYAQDHQPPPDPKAYADMVIDAVGHLGCRLMFEPGRLLVGNAGVLVSGTIYVKQTEERRFLILDSAMNDLIRPAMYEAHHDIVPLHDPTDREFHEYDVVGPVCETGDTFATLRKLPEIRAGERVAFRTAGAYGAVMSSEYNSRPMIPEIMVSGSDWSVVRARPTYDEMLGRDSIPEWIRPVAASKKGPQAA